MPETFRYLNQSPAELVTPLEMDGEEFRAQLAKVTDRLADYLDTLPDQPAWNVEGSAESANVMKQSAPAAGRELDDVLQELFDQLHAGFNPASPGYLAFVPGGGLPLSSLGSLVADIVNRFVSVWIAAPWLAQIETSVVRWFCDLIGYDGKAGGYLATGGSMANWTAIVTARRCCLPDDFLRGTIYVSDQVHHCVNKAAVLAGFPADNVKVVRSDNQFRIDTADLRRRIESDRHNEMQPFAIVGSAGTTNTGAVDDLNELANIAQGESMWFHVDAAYGGFFVLTDRGKLRLAGIERADSVTLDPHKGLFLPFGCGCLLVREFDSLRRAHHVHADYLPDMQQVDDRVDFCDVSLELSRNVRGLQVWLPVQVHTWQPFRDSLNEKLDLTQWAWKQLMEMSKQLNGQLEVINQPELSTIAFRLHPDGLDDEAQLQRLNERFRESINASKQFFLTPTLLADRYVIRICILSFRTHAAHVEACLQAIWRASHEML